MRTPFFFCLVVIASPAQADELLRDTIDREVAAIWKRENVSPTQPTSDAEFLRRVYLDLVGSIPTYDEAVAFLDDATADKRTKLIDRLLDDPRFAQHQANLWDLTLFSRHPPGYDTDKRDGFQRWIREQFEKNTPYDVWAKAILQADGNTVDDGTPMFYVQYRNQPEDATEAITQLFLGVQLQCARCHDHPYESWKQVDFYGMAAFVSRLDVVSVGKQEQLTKYAIGERSSGDILFTGPVKEQKPGKKGDPIKPKFLHGDELAEPPLPEGYKEVKFEANKPPPAPMFSRKNQLAEWITRQDNPYFAHAIANRIWAQYLGRGLVHPVDNMSESNKPSHPELLDTLAKQLVEQKFDLKWYMRELVSSRTYQLSGIGGSGEQFPRWFESARTRPLSAEELLESWRVATGYLLTETGEKKKQGRFRPLEGGYVMRFFGQPNTGTGDFQGGLAEHLYLNNGPLSSLMSNGKGTLMDAVSQSDVPLEQRVERLFLSLLNRRPTDAERAKFVEYVTPDGKTGERWREATWVLMTCGEFRFNH